MYEIVIDCLLSLIHMPPFVDISKHKFAIYKLSVDNNGKENIEIILASIAMLMAIKFKIFVRVIAFYSPLNSSKGRFIV
jgi:hypothetical protein